MFDPVSRTHLQGSRPTVVAPTAFIRGMLNDDRLILLDAHISDEANDEDFATDYLIDPIEAVAGLPRDEEKPAVKPSAKRK